MKKNLNNEGFYKRILCDSPLGYAYHEILIDKNGVPCDYRFLEVNAAFEKLTGLSANDIIGNNVKDIMPTITDDPTDWISLYGDVALKSNNIKFTSFSEPLQRWYNVEAFSPRKKYFITLFTDITDLKNVEDELVKSKTLLNASLNSPKDIIILSLDKHYKYLYFNESHRNAMKFAYNTEIEADKCLFDYMSDDRDIKKAKFNYDKALNGQAHVTREMYGDVNVKTYETYYNPIIDQDNNVIGVSAFSRDISELTDAIKELENEKLTAQKYLDIAGVMLLLLDTNGDIQLINKKGCHILGLDRNNIIGKNWFENFIPKNILNKTFTFFKDVVQKNNSLDMLDYENPIIDSKGNEKIIYWHNTILNDIDGNTIGILCSGEDMTEINKANVKLKASEKKLSLILANVEEAVYGVNLNGECTFVNQSFLEMLGYKEHEVVGKNMHKLIHHSYPDGTTYPADKCPMGNAFRNGDEVKIDFDYLWQKNGEKIPVEYACNPVYHADKLTGAVVTFKDISERMRYLGELEYAGYHDFLTGLNNRRLYQMKINELDQSKQYPFAILNFDVNGLKMFNDVYGHKTGDDVLKETAKIISSNLPKDSVVVRLGGDEFAAIIINANKENINDMKDRISKKISKVLIKNINLSIAVGSYIKRDNLVSLEDAQKFAEDDMLKDKISENSSYRSHAIQAIFKTLTSKYDEEKIHSQYVSSLSVSIGRALGLDNNQIKLLKMAALYHDIGKISIPDYVLKKPGKLTKDEYEIIKTHTEIGYQILNTADQYSDLAKHALYHHERWDGHGYPRGLIKEEIPLFSRIICLADSYQAMTSDRVYRKKMTQTEAIKEVVRCSGSQFDPNIAKVFIEKALKKQWNKYVS